MIITLHFILFQCFYLVSLFRPQPSNIVNESPNQTDALEQCVQFVGEEGERCNRLGKELSELNSCVGRFRTQYDLISSKSRSLHDACESLVSEQATLTFCC